ncbi:MAG: hypothetical protein J7497_08225, partial [Chitinophagaceae bacterium]|nr:hypothetical protein [Chitinophagaceae bacterium]
PSFTFNGQSSFYIGTPENFNKENNTEIYGMYEVPKLKLRLTGRYLLLSNFTYYKDFKQPAQYNTLFNVLQVSAEKSFRLTKDFNWRTWVIVQQPTGSAPLNLPLIFTKNQISYDGNLGFKNLRTSFGFEIRYWTPYNGDGYSPLLGQFFNQNDEKIKLNFPETAGYMHFRIKSFTAYIRVENLNSLDLASGGFVNNNIVSPNYPYPGLLFRVGIYWSFVN